MQELEYKFKEEFNTDNYKIIKSPLRICPLGAHIDHQEGLVTGMALDAYINMVYAPDEDGNIKVLSTDFPGEENFRVDNIPGKEPKTWGNYLRGSVLSLKRDYQIKKGIKAIVSGEMPIGGLSSSAAVITAYLLALCDVNNIELTKTELIKYNHWVEREFIGLKNGKLDQSSNILSKDGYLMYLDCKTNKHQLIKKSDNIPEFEIVVAYSGLSTALTDTGYNNRVDECKVAAWILQEFGAKKISSLNEIKLRDIDIETYQKYKEKIPGRFQKRAEHFFTEFNRVKKGIKAWENGNIEAFGELMLASGESSINKYECGCPELITLFNILKQTPGVYGTRFSGGGYRGSCIGLIDPDYKEIIKESIDQVYPKKHPEYKNDYGVYFCKTDDGARISDQSFISEVI